MGNKIKLLSTIFAVVMVSGYLMFYFANPETVVGLTGEDGFFESLGAIAFLFASIIFFSTYRKDTKGNNFIFIKTKKNIFFLLLGLLFFVAFGEEISWGQRLLNIETPEILQKINTQDEINIHNIKIFHTMTDEGERKSFFALLFNIDRLFSMFWLFYCFLIPLIFINSKSSQSLVSKVNLPIVPLNVGLFFPVNYLLSRITELHYSNTWNIVEFKECVFAGLFLLLSIVFYVTCSSSSEEERKRHLFDRLSGYLVISEEIHTHNFHKQNKTPRN